MSASKRLWLAVASWLAALLILAAAAGASSFTTLYNEYRQTGTISPCKHSTAELQGAVSQVPPDITQYAPDFPAALQAALQARAAGRCAGGHDSAAPQASATGVGTGGSGGPLSPSATGSATPAPSPAPAPITPSVAKLATATHASGASAAPAPVVVLAILTAALALAALWWLVASLRGEDPRWLGPARHAFSEAGYRAEGALEEFGDWLRLGR